MGTIDTSIAAAAALFSAAAGLAAYKTAKEANRTSGAMAQIERDRWHTEMTPQVQLSFDNASGAPHVVVKFLGPAPLTQIETVLRIRDDRERGSSQVGGAPTAPQVADVVWGPYRFRPGVDGADPLGRAVAPFVLVHRGHTRFALEPTPAPSWYPSAQVWHDDYDGTKLRLWVECSAQGHKPWILSADLTTATNSSGLAAIAQAGGQNCGGQLTTRPGQTGHGTGERSFPVAEDRTV
ncbi:hypothetical protein ACLQ18_07880 [Streptomyces sp. DT193]|uniref:hypothetical protein n=1 Tax=Streptomyces sp. DT193 TaxID=3393418 RepID=UPI003CEE0556